MQIDNNKVKALDTHRVHWFETSISKSIRTVNYTQLCYKYITHLKQKQIDKNAIFCFEFVVELMYTNTKLAELKN